MQNRRLHHLLIPPFLRYDQVKNKLLGFSVSLSRRVNSIDGRHTCFTMLTGHSCSSDLLISFTWLHNFFTPDSHFLAPWVFSVLGSQSTNPRKGRLPHHFFCHKGFGRWLVHHFSSWWVGASKHWKWKCYFSMEVFTLKMPLKWRNFQVSTIFWKNSCVFFSKCHTCAKVVLSNRTISNAKHGWEIEPFLRQSLQDDTEVPKQQVTWHGAWCLILQKTRRSLSSPSLLFAMSSTKNLETIQAQKLLHNLCLQAKLSSLIYRPIFAERWGQIGNHGDTAQQVSMDRFFGHFLHSENFGDAGKTHWQATKHTAGIWNSIYLSRKATKPPFQSDISLGNCENFRVTSKVFTLKIWVFIVVPQSISNWSFLLKQGRELWELWFP